MTVITTVAGDELDQLLELHYGAELVSTALSAVLAANLGLAALGIRVPAGTRIVLPDLPSATSRRVSLW